MCFVFALYPCAGAQGGGPCEKMSCGMIKNSVNDKTKNNFLNSN